MEKDFFLNAKLYCVNLNKFTFDKHNQGCIFCSKKDHMHIYAEQYLKFPLII